MSVRSQDRPLVSKQRRINLRVDDSVDARIRAAAEAQGVSLTDFITQAAVDEADRLFLEQRHFELDADQWDELMAYLDRPARITPRLEELLAQPRLRSRDEPDILRDLDPE